MTNKNLLSGFLCREVSGQRRENRAAKEAPTLSQHTQWLSRTTQTQVLEGHFGAFVSQSGILS